MTPERRQRDLARRRFLQAAAGPRVFPDERARARLKHNVEEAGNFEFFLRQLHASQTGRPQ